MLHFFDLHVSIVSKAALGARGAHDPTSRKGYLIYFQVPIKESLSILTRWRQYPSLGVLCPRGRGEDARVPLSPQNGEVGKMAFCIHVMLTFWITTRGARGGRGAAFQIRVNG
jgi:hypothetical protein